MVAFVPFSKVSYEARECLYFYSLYKSENRSKNLLKTKESCREIERKKTERDLRPIHSFSLSLPIFRSLWRAKPVLWMQSGVALRVCRTLNVTRSFIVSNPMWSVHILFYFVFVSFLCLCFRCVEGSRIRFFCLFDQTIGVFAGFFPLRHFKIKTEINIDFFPLKNNLNKQKQMHRGDLSISTREE